MAMEYKHIIGPLYEKYYVNIILKNIKELIN